MKKILSGILVLCLSFALLSACDRGGQPDKTVTAGGLTFAKSYSEVYSALTDAQKAIAERNTLLNTGADSSEPNGAGAAGEGSEGTFYSGTNVQVEGVDEGDIVKTDGKYIYILRGSEMVVMQADGKDVTDVSNVFVGQDWEQTTTEDGLAHTQEKLPTELYLSGSRAVVVSAYSDWTATGGTDDKVTGFGKDYVAVDIYDVTDPAAPTLVKSFGQDGYKIASRMIDGVLYLCSSYYPANPEKGDETTFAPRLYDGDAATVMPCGSIGLMPDGNSMTYAVAASYDIASGERLSSQSVLGGGDNVYMNKDNLYLCASIYDDGAGKTYKDGSYTVTDYTSSVNTVVNRFAIADGKLTFAANGAVPGALNNQFSLDERDGYLRMATTEQTYSYSVYRDEKHDFENTKADEDGMQTRNDVYVLDASLKTVGSVTGLAEGEQVFSARFDGDYGYLCTYRQTDPVFAVDLTEPTNPKVVGELKLSGYSDYLHVWSDGLLFGLGMETQSVGANTTVDGMKLVMIDTSDPAKLHDLHTQAIDADYSEALNNHKAILVDGNALIGRLDAPRDGCISLPLIILVFDCGEELRRTGLRLRRNGQLQVCRCDSDRVGLRGACDLERCICAASRRGVIARGGDGILARLGLGPDGDRAGGGVDAHAVVSRSHRPRDLFGQDRALRGGRRGVDGRTVGAVDGDTTLIQRDLVQNGGNSVDSDITILGCGHRSGIFIHRRFETHQLYRQLLRFQASFYGKC